MNLVNLPFHLDNFLAGLCRWPRCRCCPPTWTLSRPQSQPAVRTERCTSTNKSLFIFILCYVMIYKVLHVILSCNVWPVATIVGFDHCNCLIPILLWHLCIQELARIESPWYWAILCSMLLLLLYCVLRLTQAKKCNTQYLYRL